jgi:hypothetical protein
MSYMPLFFVFVFEKWDSWIPPDGTRLLHKIITGMSFDQQSISVLYSLSYQFHCSRSHTPRLLDMIAAMGGFLLFYDFFVVILTTTLETLMWYYCFDLFFSCMLMEENRKWHVRFRFHSFLLKRRIYEN